MSRSNTVNFFANPKYFFSGVFLGFIFCVVAGHIVSQKAYFKNFTRFILPIQPQTQYYPTAHELLVTALHEVPADKILVLIGGNSILKGIGQNPDELWSIELQRALGDRYKVLNYAMDGATFTSFGAVAFRVLKEKFPKIIFVGTCVPGGVDPLDGMEVYKYLFWDAYYKKLFHASGEELHSIVELRKKEMQSTSGIELHVLSYLDSCFYFRNLWNWIGYQFTFTVWTDHVPKAPFRHRVKYKDNKTAHLKEMADKTVNTPENFKMAIKTISKYVSNLENRESWEHAKVILENSFSSEIRNKILCIVPVANPKYIAKLPKPDAYIKVINNSEKLLSDQGYHAIAVGKDFSPEDYIDQGHFLGAGGKKMAGLVAGKIEEIAKDNEYV